MGLARLKIKPEVGEEITVQFNPASYSTSKSVTWGNPKSEASENGKKCAGTNRKLNAPVQVFGGGGSRTISFDLFFDVTETVDRGKGPETIKDVRVLTNDLVKLTRIDRNAKKPKPPTCTITWGDPDARGLSDLPFRGNLTNLAQRFTFFDSGTGNPLRAEVGVTFTEALNEKADLKETDPDFTTRVVKRGDTLSSIAGELYSNQALWRVIADANGVDNPRTIQVGRTLHIPKIG